MKIARVKGTVTATVKEASLTGQKFLIVDVEDGSGKVLESSLVVLDTCGSGLGELVLVAMGSAARLPAASTGVPCDATIIAIIDNISLEK